MRKTGFTLIELMVVVAIAAIMLAIAAPNFQSFFEQNRLTSQANQLAASFNLARSEAITRNTTVTVCKSSNTNTNAPTCDTTPSGWETGWIIFIDLGVTGEVNPGDTIIRVIDAMNSVSLQGGANFFRGIRYNGDGTSQGITNSGALGLQNGTLTLRYVENSTATNRGRDIVINNAGRISIRKVTS